LSILSKPNKSTKKKPLSQSLFVFLERFQPIPASLLLASLCFFFVFQPKTPALPLAFNEWVKGALAFSEHQSAAPKPGKGFPYPAPNNS
jgi:hypothetical protein